MDPEPRQKGAPLPAPSEGKVLQGTRQGSEGVGGPLLPAPIWPRSYCDPPQEGGPGPERQVLVVWQRRETVAPPPFHQVPTLDAGDQANVTKS